MNESSTTDGYRVVCTCGYSDSGFPSEAMAGLVGYRHLKGLHRNELMEPHLVDTRPTGSDELGTWLGQVWELSEILHEDDYVEGLKATRGLLAVYLVSTVDTELYVRYCPETDEFQSAARYPTGSWDIVTAPEDIAKDWFRSWQGEIYKQKAVPTDKAKPFHTEDL